MHVLCVQEWLLDGQLAILSPMPLAALHHISLITGTVLFAVLELDGSLVLADQ